MIPITLIAGIVCELIIGKYDNSKYIAIAFSVAIFIDKINSILLTIILGVEQAAHVETIALLQKTNT